MLSASPINSQDDRQQEPIVPFGFLFEELVRQEPLEVTPYYDEQVGVSYIKLPNSPPVAVVEATSDELARAGTGRLSVSTITEVIREMTDKDPVKPHSQVRRRINLVGTPTETKLVRETTDREPSGPWQLTRKRVRGGASSVTFTVAIATETRIARESTDRD